MSHHRRGTSDFALFTLLTFHFFSYTSSWNWSQSRINATSLECAILSEGTIPELGYVSHTRTRDLLDLPQLHDELSKLLLAGTATVSVTNQSKLATTVDSCILPEVLDGKSKRHFFFSRKWRVHRNFVTIALKTTVRDRAVSNRVSCLGVVVGGQTVTRHWCQYCSVAVEFSTIVFYT